MGFNSGFKGLRTNKYENILTRHFDPADGSSLFLRNPAVKLQGCTLSQHRKKVNVVTRTAHWREWAVECRRAQVNSASKSKWMDSNPSRSAEKCGHKVS